MELATKLVWANLHADSRTTSICRGMVDEVDMAPNVSRQRFSNCVAVASEVAAILD